MLPNFVGENIVEGEEKREQTQVSYDKCNKCFVELSHDNYIENPKKEDVKTRLEEKIELFANFIEKHFFISIKLVLINERKRIL